MSVFATLGPNGSNHELVTRAYLAFHKAKNAKIHLVDNFIAALASMKQDEVDFLVQAAAHSSTTQTLAKGFFEHGIHAIDVFIAPSRPLAVLTQLNVEQPKSIGLQPATRHYTDISRWSNIFEEPNTVAVAQGLLNGRYDSGIVAADLVDIHPNRFRIGAFLGSVDDPWIVYGKRRLCEGAILAWPNSPAAALYRSCH